MLDWRTKNRQQRVGGAQRAAEEGRRVGGNRADAVLNQTASCCEEPPRFRPGVVGRRSRQSAALRAAIRLERHGNSTKERSSQVGSVDEATRCGSERSSTSPK